MTTPLSDNSGDSVTAAAAGQFTIGGDLSVNRLGYGAMRVTGEGVWGEPADRVEALRTLSHLPQLDVNFVDTADSYGPYVSEELLREALHPYEGMVIATKGGLVRHGPTIWKPLGRPEYLRQCVLLSMRRLAVERIDLWQLHRIDPLVPRDEQLDCIAQMQKEGLIRHVGLSQATVEDITAASAYFNVATVQNRFNLVDRSSEDVLTYCEQNGIGFIPWYPLAAGDLAKPGSVLDRIAKEQGALPSQVALAWLLQCSPVMLPIPGTSKAQHLIENVGAAAISLSDEQFTMLDEEGRKVFSEAAP